MKKLTLLLCLLFSLLTTKTNASHFSGGYITYAWDSLNVYDITLHFYRDCSGIPAPNNPTINIISPSCGLNSFCTLSFVSERELIAQCVNVTTTCNFGSFPGIQEIVYKGTYDFGSNYCSDISFTFTICCRNNNINDISNPGTSIAYLYSNLNNIDAPNNSPTLLNTPLSFACVGTAYCFDAGASDADGDSLSYTQTTPRIGSNTIVSYINPYTYQQPIISTPTATFDSTTGKFCANPQVIQIGVMAIIITDWRNGVEVGEVEVDIEIIVISCPCEVLPVEWLEFKGYNQGMDNVITWSTASEINNHYFVLLRNNEPIQIINGNGTTTVTHSYTFVDEHADVLSYYQLKQVDYDGKINSSSMIVVKNRLRMKNPLNKNYNIIGQQLK